MKLLMTKSEAKEWDRIGTAGQTHIYQLQQRGVVVKWDTRRRKFLANGRPLGPAYWRQHGGSVS